MRQRRVTAVHFNMGDEARVEVRTGSSTVMLSRMVGEMRLAVRRELALAGEFSSRFMKRRVLVPLLFHSRIGPRPA
jgi:hypothetical protein